MSENLRDVAVGIGFEDNATVSLNKLDKKVDNIVDNFGAMGKEVSRASIGVADLGDSAKKATKDLEKIDKRHKLWQQTASGMDKVLHSNEMQTDALTRKIGRLDKELQNYPETLGKISKKYGENSKEVEEYKNNILDLRLEHAKLNKELGGLGAARMGQSLTKAGGTMTSAGGWMTTRLTLPIVAAAGASVKTFITLEEAFAGVEKTVDGTDVELKNVRKELDYMASNTIPVARKELYGIAENAGQLGIKTKDVTRFTTTIAKLGATTNLTYDTASSEIARFANITGMSMDNIDRLGSTIVELGNNTSTTEAEIVSMAMRLGAAGKQVGMTQAEIMGLAAGMSSLGMESEAGGSAVSKLLFDMQDASMSGGKQLNKYAKVAGMTGKEFKLAFQKNAANALVMFTDGLGKMQKNGKNVIAVLDDMGLSEVRLRDAILRAAGSNDILNSTINMGNIAWEQNIALNEEFSKKSKTSASNIQLMKSKVEEVGNAFGEHLIPYVNTGLDGVTKMVNKFGELSPKNQKRVFDGLLGVAVAGPALKTLGKFATKLGTLNTAVASAGGWGPYIAGAGAAIKAFALGPVGIAIGAVAALSGGLYLLYKNWDKVKGIWDKAKDNTIKAFSERPNIQDMPLGYYRKDAGAVPSSMIINKNKPANTNTNPYPAYNYIPNKVGRNALGTNYWRGGDTELGERGMELVVGRQTRNLARGSKVINARDTEEIFNNSTSNSTVVRGDTFAPSINVYLTNGNKNEIDKVKREIEKQIELLLENYFYKMKLKMLMSD